MWCSTAGSDPRWTFSAASEHFEPGLLLPGELTGTPPATALAFNVHAQGQGGKADLKGQFKQGEQTIVLQPSRLQLANQMLMVEPLVIDAFGGRTNLRGKVDLRDPANTRFHFSVNARGLSFKPSPEPGILKSEPCRLFSKRRDWECPAPFVPGQQSAVHG